MALADDIALYAYGYWSHEHHPFRINAICLNVKQRKHPCRACTDACPQGIVLHSGKANWTGCTNCNLCVTACPTAAINQSATSFAAIRKLILEGDAPVSFACERANEPSDASCVCLATIPWDLCAAAALTNGVVLKAEHCKTCPHASFVAKVKELVHTLQHFLGKERFSETVYMHDQAQNMRSSGLDKRMAFGRVANNVAAGAEKALSGDANPTMSCYRALLLEVLEGLRESGEPAKVSWPTLVEDGNCRACEICTKMCPHQALELQIPGYTDLDDSANAQETEEEASARGQKWAGGTDNDSLEERGQFLFHNASKCTQCGLCYISCPNENLGGWDTLATSTIPALRAYPVNVHLCEKCGRPFKPEADETQCSVCSRKPFSAARR